MKNLTVAVLLLFFLPAGIFCAGGVGPDFLRMEPGARTAAMGNAFCGVADDLNSIIFNPAGLINLKNPVISLTHYSSFADTNYEFVCFGMPGGELGAFGGSVVVDYTTDFTEFDEWGDEVGTVENYDAIVTASYAYPVMAGFSAGINVKYFYSRLYTYSKNGAAVDLGILTQIAENPDVFAGFTIQHLGFQTAYIEVVDTMPVNLKGGMGFKYNITEDTAITVGLDVNRLWVKDEDPTLEIGADFLIYDAICLRGGYGLRHDDAGLTVGLGVLLDQINVSYAYQPYEMLGTAHRITLDVELR